MVYIGERGAYELVEKLSVLEATKHSSMPRDGYFLGSIGTNRAELLASRSWIGVARQFFQLRLLSSSVPAKCFILV